MTESSIQVRALDELDLEAIGAIDEKISGRYQPDVWERRVGYYLRRDPDASLVAEIGGEVVGFMLGEVRSGEFGLDEPTGWVEVLGVDPARRGQSVGRKMAEAMFEHFRGRGAKAVRTFVDDERQDLGEFFSALGFEPASLRPYVRRLQHDC
ncbi:MAG: GNAT family N-acetyltransferase [Acidobacteriota bacterium]